MLSAFSNFIQDEAGQGTIEYAGVLAFAAGLLIALNCHPLGASTSIPFGGGVLTISIGALINAVSAIQNGIWNMGGS